MVKGDEMDIVKKRQRSSAAKTVRCTIQIVLEVGLRTGQEGLLSHRVHRGMMKMKYTRVCTIPNRLKKK